MIWFLRVRSAGTLVFIAPMLYNESYLNHEGRVPWSECDAYGALR